ncbi:hypothetical protein [Agarilytica rhodophyticola]|uniref:hypothetical protein n=1 Tax=Agarilytica rhodophyticola TaxID=1737490 RepID=UPI000B34A129|nr:hypothetical protein [Agarilytica rhodophyticola]
MYENRYIKTSDSHRSRTYEFFLVLAVIGFIIYMGINYYLSPMGKTKESMLEFHAGIFSRMMSNLNAYGASVNKNYVNINGHTFFLNENGWPANTHEGFSPLLENQTEDECQQLWLSVFRNPPSNEISKNRYIKKVDYIISLNEKVICRYQLARRQEGSFFFDYDVSNGVVKVIMQ